MNYPAASCGELNPQRLKDGDTVMEKRAGTVTEVLVLSDGLSKMASYQSSHLKEFSKAYAVVCKDCKDEGEGEGEKIV